MSYTPEQKRAYDAKWREKNRDRIREYGKRYSAKAGHITRVKDLRLKYGITPEQYEAMLSAQGRVCKICGKTPKENGKFLTIDHCHKTKCVRGLVCYRCNTGLASFKDDPQIVKKAAQYLGVTFNAHDELVAALRDALIVFDQPDTPLTPITRARILKLLAKAEPRP